MFGIANYCLDGWIRAFNLMSALWQRCMQTQAKNKFRDYDDEIITI